MPRARVHWFIILIYFIKSASSRKIKNFLIETEGNRWCFLQRDIDSIYLYPLDYDRNTNVVPEGKQL